MTTRRSERPSDRVSQYVADLQRRYPQFRKEHNAELAQIGTDFIGRLFHDYFLFGDRTALESLLHVMLTNEERDRLQVDPEFTQAWLIFVDMCWLRKRVQRALLVLVFILLCLGLLLLIYLLLPFLIGPRSR